MSGFFSYSSPQSVRSHSLLATSPRSECTLLVSLIQVKEGSWWTLWSVRYRYFIELQHNLLSGHSVILSLRARAIDNSIHRTIDGKVLSSLPSIICSYHHFQVSCFQMWKFVSGSRHIMSSHTRTQALGNGIFKSLTAASDILPKSLQWTGRRLVEVRSTYHRDYSWKTQHS